jgi:hypothetical protein
MKIHYGFRIMLQGPCKDPAELFREFLIRKEDGHQYLDFEKLVPMPPEIKAIFQRWKELSDAPEMVALREEDRKRWNSQHGVSDQLIWLLKYWGCLGPHRVSAITPDGLTTSAFNGIADPIVAQLAMKVGVPLRVVWCQLEDYAACGFYDADISGEITGQGFAMPDTPSWILEALGYPSELLTSYRELQAQ